MGSRLLFAFALLFFSDSLHPEQLQSSQAAKAKPVLIFTFDDGYASTFTECFPLLKRLKIKAVAYLISSAVDEPPLYLTAKQVGVLYRGGWTIGNHTRTHRFLNTENEQETLREIRDCDEFLQQHGWLIGRNRHFCFPGGKFTLTADSVLRKLNYVTARTSEEGTQPQQHVEWLRLNSYFVSASRNQPAGAVQFIDRVIQEGACGILMFHKVGKGSAGDEYTIPTSQFEKIAAYAARERDAGSLDILTVDEWYKRSGWAKRPLPQQRFRGRE
jgi:hypothetical protein